MNKFQLLSLLFRPYLIKDTNTAPSKYLQGDLLRNGLDRQDQDLDQELDSSMDNFEDMGYMSNQDNSLLYHVYQYRILLQHGSSRLSSRSVLCSHNDIRPPHPSILFSPIACTKDI
jgi:hypothetical protein